MEEKIFYRYVPIKKRIMGKIVDEVERTRTLNILTDNSLYFSYPQGFNDPFDCHIFCHYEGTKSEWIEYINKDPDEVRKKQAIEILESINYDSKKIEELYYYVNHFSHYPNIISCFSEINDNILMWAHYASQHSGMCLGFKSINEKGLYYLDMEEKVDLFSPTHKALLREVKYHDNYPNIINPVKNMNFSYESFQVTKSKAWEYEKEYRILIHSKSFNDYRNKYGKRSFKFKKDILSEVIFGVRMVYEDMKEIADIVTKYYIKEGIDVKLYKAKINEYSYGIKLETFEVDNQLKYRWNL